MDKTLTPDNDLSFWKDLTDQVYCRLFVTPTELVADSVYFDGPGKGVKSKAPVIAGKE